MAALLAAFERAADPDGQAELALIAGQPGAGKTSLARELHPALSQRGGYYASGKFERLQRDIPYSALRQAWRALIRQILGEPAAQVADWRARLLEALGANAQVMLEVIPELELIIGPQPPAAELPPGQAQNRYRLVFQNFARVFARREHPLTLFLDDLQWADAASLELLEFLAAAPGQQYLLILGAYRDNEVDAHHPVRRTVERIRQAGGRVTELALAALSLEDITEFIQAAFHVSTAAARPLAAVLAAKTGGNPFFNNEFLKTLVTRQLIRCEPEVGWRWDLEQIRAQPVADNVVDLLAGRIGALPPAAQASLKLAAGLGGQFDLRTLALAAQTAPRQTAAAIWPAVEAGLVIPLSDAYNLAAYSDAAEPAAAVEYRFAHDRIRQAVEALIPPAESERLHLQLGQLLNGLPPRSRAEKIFDIANHLNLASGLLQSAADRQALAHINWQAGRRAKKSAAFGPAWHFLQTGLSLLEPDSWSAAYDLALGLHLDAIEAAYSSGLLEPCPPLIEAVLTHARRLQDQSIAHQIMIKLRVAQNQPVAALEHALGVLRQLGVDLPLYPTEADVERGLQNVRALLAGRSIDDLADLPEMTDPDRLAAMHILTSTTVAAFNAIRPLYALISFERVSLSIRSGNTPMSPAAYASYGLTLCGDPAQIEAGYQFGRLALRLLDKLDAAPFRARTIITAYSFVMHWKDPLRGILDPVLQAYHSGLETGDIEFASAALLVHAYTAFLSGLELPALNEIFAAHVRRASSLGHPRNYLVLKMHWQLVLNLLQPEPTPHLISGEIYPEETALPFHLQGSDFLTIFRLYAYKTLICCMFGRYPAAAECLQTLEKYLSTARSESVSTLYYFYDSLVRLALCPSQPESARPAELKRVAANQARLEVLAQHAPANQRHRYCLIEAERARLDGLGGQAREWYDQAIRLARENQFPQDEGLAAERAAGFYLERGQARLAGLYLSDARSAYARWGALGKVRDMEARYPQHFTIPGASLARTHTLALDGALEVASLIKASQALSSEIVLDRLLAKLMEVIVESAGAQIGCLLLEEGGQWVIAAGAGLAAGQPIEADPAPLALSVARYVIRSHETVALDDAAQAGAYRTDAYIARQQTRSLLCLPLLKQNNLVGVLYLENNLAAGAFTAGRLEFLRLLSAQAAISIENARFYDTLERKVAERTAALSEANHKLQQLSELDGLTGVANRRKFDVVWDLEWRRAIRRQAPLAVALLDIDHFKAYNDHYGHPSGDACLQMVAKTIEAAAQRSGELAVRYGGEEFAIILPGLDAAQARQAAENIRRAVADLRIPHLRNSAAPHVTVSLGVYSHRPTLSTPAEAMLAEADARLYQAKHLGRNQVCGE